VKRKRLVIPEPEDKLDATAAAGVSGPEDAALGERLAGQGRTTSRSPSTAAPPQ